LQDINRRYKNGKKKYCDKLITKSKNKPKTTWKIIKKGTGTNNCHNGIKSLKFNKTISNNPQEIANTFNDYFSTVKDTVTGYIKEGNSSSRDNMNPSNYLINNFNSTFSRINWKYATT